MQRLIQMENKLQKLKEVIQKANPEIMELGFGCEVEYGGKNYTYAGVGKGGVKFFRENHRGELDVITTIETGFKIIGRKIGIADVLVAMEELFGDLTTYMENGDVRSTLNVATLLRTYNLLDDNLDSQSEETINFLHSLLVKN